MQRAEGDAVTDGLLAGFVDDAAFDKLVAAVQDAVAHSVDLVDGLDDAVSRVDENGHNSFDGFLVGGHRDVLFDLLAGSRNLVGQLAVKTDALAKALGGDIAGVRVHELILETGAASVDNQYIHNSIHSCVSFFSNPCYYIITGIHHTTKAKWKQELFDKFLPEDGVCRRSA